MPAAVTSTYSTRPFGRRALKRELFWHELRRRRFLNLGAVRTFQLQRLQDLVAYAAANVPFYRDRFRGIGLEPGDVRTFEDFSRIPMLTRDEILKHLPALRSRVFREDRLLLLGTGGSTGVPMNYYKDIDYLDRSQVILARSQQWTGKGRWELMAFFGSKREPCGFRGHVKRALRALSECRLYFDAFGASNEDLAEWVVLLWRYRPPFAYGYPSALEHFARWVRERSIRLPPFRGLIVSAEILYEHQRSLLAEVFGTPVFNFYGSREVQNIAAVCRAQSMHQVADWVYTEFVPSPDLPAPQIVVTPLESFGMPLIRYANGDLGKPAAGSCPCGLPFPLMDLSVARVVDVFVTPEGKHIYGQFFTHLLYGIAGIKQFQFHQVTTDLVRLLIVKDDTFDAATAQKLDEANARIHRQASPFMQVRVEYVDEIPRTAVGKHIFTRSDVWANRGHIHAAAAAGVAPHSDKP